MNGVIIEYKHECRIRIIEQAIQRRIRQKTLIIKKRVREVNIISITTHPHTKPIRIPNTSIQMRTKGGSWKRKHTGKRAPKRQFERHPHRIKKTPQIHKYPIYLIKEVT
jgi:hypothetical protein